MVEEMIRAINARSEAEGLAAVKAQRREAANARHRKIIHEKTLEDMAAILTLNAGFLGILILMGIGSM